LFFSIRQLGIVHILGFLPLAYIFLKPPVWCVCNTSNLRRMSLPLKCRTDSNKKKTEPKHWANNISLSRLNQTMVRVLSLYTINSPSYIILILRLYPHRKSQKQSSNYHQYYANLFPCNLH